MTVRQRFESPQRRPRYRKAEFAQRATIDHPSEPSGNANIEVHVDQRGQS